MKARFDATFKDAKVQEQVRARQILVKTAEEATHILDQVRTRKIGFIVLGVTLPLMIAVAGVLSIEEEPLSTLRPASNTAAIGSSMKSLPRAKPMPAIVPTVAPLVAPAPKARRRN